MDTREPVVLVTGASSGIGNACATYLAKRGCKVYGTCRNPGSYAKKADEFFELLALDLGSESSVAAAVEAIYAAEGRLDAVLCNAGMGISGAVEDNSLADIERQMDTNFLGAARVIKAVLPRFREAGAGKILVVSSLGGIIGMPFQAFYSASKHALEGLVESLRYELRPFGVQACLIEPGDFRTGFTAAREHSVPEGSPYKPYVEAALGVQERDEAAGHDPIEIAKLVQRLVAAPRLKPRYSAGPAFERAAIILKGLMPSGLFEFLYGKYCKL